MIHMMIATNWGVYEIAKRHAEFIEPGDTRQMEIRARRKQHLATLRQLFPSLAETFSIKDGSADFPFRAFISRSDLALLLATLEMTIDYVEFKKDARDPELHHLLNVMWTSWLRTWPKFSKHTTFTRRQRSNRWM
jgi:hypothetical protein